MFNLMQSEQNLEYLIPQRIKAIFDHKYEPRYKQKFLEKVEKVEMEDVKKLARQLSKLLNPETSITVFKCYEPHLEAIENAFKSGDFKFEFKKFEP